MTISIIGTGYVGLVTGTCFSEMGNTVWCIDIDKAKIENLQKGILPIYEPGLEKMVARNYQEGRLHFTADYAQAVEQSKICFIAVGTPPGEDGSADVSYVLSAARSIAQYMEDYMVIVDKSTVPVGTSEKVREAVQKVLDERTVKTDFDVVSNPEFLKEGVAVEDFLRPDRVVIGTDSAKARAIMEKLYEPFVSNGHPLLVMDIKSAEITKYAANAMLATRISFMNEIAKLCDTLGGDVKAVRQGIGTDKRIGMSFLYAGCGYGGSCFPKNVKKIIARGGGHKNGMKNAQAVEAVNEVQKHILVQHIIRKYGENLSGKTFALWGLAFKPQTDDMREAPSIVIINELIKRGAHIRAYDPEAYQTAKHYLNHIDSASLTYEKDMWTPLSSADALILVTEWKQFRQPDFDRIKQLLKVPVIFDGRNQYGITMMKELEIEYHCIGRNA